VKRHEMLVIKRDGSIEPFELPKLRTALARVMKSAACDEKLADPLARAVAAHLEEWDEPTPPTTDYVFRCVKSVLQQTGLEEAARDFVRQRRARDQRRRTVRIVDRDLRSRRFQAWRKSAVVTTLKVDYGIGHAAARFLAGRTEDQIFALNYRLVSKTLITELMRNELLAWGLADEPLKTDRTAVGPRD
jgi:hypothetical protein